LYDLSRVAHTLSFMYAPHEHAQHPYHRVLSVACPGFLTVADIKGDVGATRGWVRRGGSKFFKRITPAGKSGTAAV
jgi:hypothetical protein